MSARGMRISTLGGVVEAAEVVAGRIVISAALRDAKYKPTFRELLGLATGDLYGLAAEIIAIDRRILPQKGDG